MPSRHNLFWFKNLLFIFESVYSLYKANNPIAVSQGSELIFDCCNIGYWCLREAGFRSSVSRKWICIEHLDCCGSFKRHKVIQILHCPILIKKPGSTSCFNVWIISNKEPSKARSPVNITWRETSNIVVSLTGTLGKWKHQTFYIWHWKINVLGLQK